LAEPSGKKGGKMKKLIRFFSLFSLMFSLSGLTALYAQEGFLRVTSVPEGVSVEIAGKSAGKTPVLTVLKPGEYTIKATMTGYEAATEKVKVQENEVTLLQIKMQKQTRKGIFQRVTTGKGNLTVITDWQDVDIYIDGYKIKESPPVTIKDITSGLHTVILVSGDYADVSRIFIRNGETGVVKKYFEEDKKKYLSSVTDDEAEAAKKKAEELAKKRLALPAHIAVNLENPSIKEEKDETEGTLWGEDNSVTLTFQYRKVGENTWNLKELNSKTKLKDNFTVEKGSYEIQLVGIHYKEPTGIINIFLGAQKEKVKEYKEVLKQEFKPDVQYTYVISYDGKTDFSYNMKEAELNTPIK
jgi:hypothetical protein